MSLRKLILEELKEVTTTKKTKVGQGLEHSIYPSKKFPDRLLKVGEKDNVEEWVEVFKSDQNIFPKIFRVGKISNYKYNESDVYFVEIEKLDTKKAETEWDYLHDKMEEIGLVHYEMGLYGRDFTDIYLNHGEDKDIIKNILEELKKYDSKSYQIFVKWFTLVKKCEETKNKISGKDSFVDAHKYNFGYDKNGNLKCLDL